MTDTIAIGEILGPYGLKGDVWVKPFAESSGTRPMPPRAGLEQGVLMRGEESAPVRIVSIRRAEDRWIATFAGTETREDAEGLRGWLIGVPRSHAAPLPPGVFYVHELLGRSVISEDGATLGRIVNVVSTGSNDVYVIEGDMGELLFPALKDLVIDCPREGGSLRVRVPPGLLEACLSRET